MYSGREILAPVTRGLLSSVAERGLCRAELLAAAGISESELAVDGWIPVERHARLGAAIAAQLPGENLGLQTGLRIYGDPQGALGYVVRRSGTHSVALENFAVYLGIVNRAMRAALRVSVAGGSFVLEMHPDLAELGHPAEALLSAWVGISRHVTGHDWCPTHVAFEHAAKADVREHEAFFRCPVSFGRSPTCLSLPAQALDLTIAPLSHELEPALARATEEAHARLASIELRSALDELAGHLREPPLLVGDYSPTATARMPVVLELTRGLLEHSNLRLYELAFLLGFDDLPAFEQAYSNRFGCPPTPRTGA